MAILQILNCEKYPPSLTFLLMTMGLAFLALYGFERRQGPGVRFLQRLGQAALAIYILHLFWLAILRQTVNWDSPALGLLQRDDATRLFTLPQVYAMFGVTLAACYGLALGYGWARRRWGVTRWGRVVFRYF